jgi:hypothetical protein
MNDDFVHLVSGEQPARFLREALQKLGRGELVLVPRDWLSEGPLQDVDAGAASRRDWYRRIGAELPEEGLEELDDAEVWTTLSRSACRVMLWHGPHAAERILALRACWHLRDEPERVCEVALVAGSRSPAFYGMVGMVAPKGLIDAWELRANVADVPARAKRWEELRDEPGDWLRVLEGEEMRRLPVTAYDEHLIAACADGWTQSILTLAKVLACNPVGYSLLRWRIRELIAAGRLEARGERTEHGLPAEVLAVEG